MSGFLRWCEAALAETTMDHTIREINKLSVMKAPNLHLVVKSNWIVNVNKLQIAYTSPKTVLLLR